MCIATVSSRVLGLLRDLLSARLFGASSVSDAFIVAFRIPNLLRELLAEGALSSAFVPIFAKVRETRGEEAAWKLTGDMLNAMLLVLSAVVIAGELSSPLLIHLLAPGFSRSHMEFSLAVSLNRMLFPFIAFMALAALFTGALNARHEFFLPALAPAITNLCLIAAGLWLCPRLGRDPSRQIFGWALGALVGGLLQFGVHLPPVLGGGFRPRFSWPFADPDVRKIFRLMVPAVFALSVTQVNLVVSQMLASYLPHGSITYLTYGARLMYLPVGIFGVAIATAVLPTLSAHVAGNRMGDFKSTLSFAMRMNVFFTVPATVGLILLAEPVNLLLLHGGLFSLEATHRVALASICYSFAILTASQIKVLVPCFYALEKPSIPVRIGIAMAALNLALSVTLMALLPLPVRFLGLAISTTLVSYCNASCLLWFLRRKIGPLGGRAMLGEGLKTLLSAALMGAAVWLAQRAFEHLSPPTPGHLYRGVEVGLLLALGLGVYFWSARSLGMREWKEWLQKRRRAPARRP